MHLPCNLNTCAPGNAKQQNTVTQAVQVLPNCEILESTYNSRAICPSVALAVTSRIVFSFFGLPSRCSLFDTWPQRLQDCIPILVLVADPRSRTRNLSASDHWLDLYLALNQILCARFCGSRSLVA